MIEFMFMIAGGVTLGVIVGALVILGLIHLLNVVIR